MAEVYPLGADQNILDDDWIARASHEGWVALTKDYANLTGSQMAARYVDNLERITASGIERRWPR